MIEKAKNHWLILIILAAAQLMVVLDSSVVNVALPAVQHAFNLTSSGLQWVVTAYTLTFGGFLLFGGRAADLFGRKKMFLIGITMFVLASLIDGMSQNGTMLVVLRAIQGLSAALMSPAALSIILVTYREGHERNTALSIWGAVGAGGAAIGVLLGGVLTQYLNWRWNFFINIPIGITIFTLAWRLLPAHESEEEHNDLDLPGAISVTGAALLLVSGIANAPTNGWTSGATIAYFVGAVILLAFFIFNERRVKNPLVPLAIFKNRNLTGANLVLFPVVASMFSTFFFGSLYMQNILHFDPVQTGLSFLITPITIAITATNVPKLVKRIGFKPVLVAGPLFILGALLVLAHVPVDGNYFVNVLPALVPLGIGAGMSFVSGTIAATSGVKPNESGLASGLLNTSQQIGGSLGLAVLTGVASSAATNYFTNLKTLPTQLTPLLAEVQGMHAAFYTGAGIALAASLIAFFVIQSPKRLLQTT
ncbi:DHA2 family efflux MFS transporter permease subunit [Patescibacteria group bacterium]|nr:MAG: DHA2 family efflux MFS transporter permease subunit [Patescibacteria group bacterium]